MEQRDKYKAGDNVLPKLRLRRAPGEEEDQRVVDQVTALSLREAGISGNTLQEPGDRRRREGGRGSRSRDSSRSTGRTRGELSQPSSRRSGQRSSRDPSREPSPRTPTRHVEHQSSLRSLMSASELDPQQMQEEILQQIAEEGLLDGIDLENMDAAQEEELSERIAQEYQKRREARLREERRQRDATVSSSRSSTQGSSGDSSSRRAERPPTETAPPTAPPVSNPHLISSANQAQPRQRRSGSQSSTRSASRVDAAVGPAGTTRSSSEVFGNSGNADTTRSTSQRSQRMPHERSSTDPDRLRVMAHRPHAQSADSAPGSPRQIEGHGAPRSHSRSRADSNPRSSSQRSPRIGATSSATFPVDRHTGPTNNSSPSLTTGLSSSGAVGLAISNTTTSEVRPNSSSSSFNRHPALFTEPAISCDRCNKAHIEYELHYNCPKCNGGKYNLCMPCYRQGKGCLHWYGFGRLARQRYQNQEPPEGYPMNHELPHILSGHRYQRPKKPIVPSPTSDLPTRAVTEEDPIKRLEDGVFCDTCSAFANACYWKCDVCNDGDWGFCNDCVNQGRHCTHPLLPLKSKSSLAQRESPQLGNDHLLPPSRSSPSQQQQLTPPLTPRSASVVHGPGHLQLANQAFQPLTFSTICDICTYPITPSLSRFHCPKCNDGDYDICSKCYLTLVSTGRISTDNGHQGWRRCLRGHRMCVIGFEDRDGGQRRIVVNELVGGWALKEEEAPVPPQSPGGTPGENMSNSTAPNWSWKDADGTTRKATVRNANFLSQHGLSPAGRFPPDGGVGLSVYAAWAYFPDEAVTDELSFPKGAEIREVEDINGDWFWGVYAGGKGLFPGNYGFVLGGSGSGR
jgi:hypothetical protein